MEPAMTGEMNRMQIRSPARWTIFSISLILMHYAVAADARSRCLALRVA
jgi:hypothetical protein